MPVTARLSRKFYDKFGDELTNELVEWLNSVDAGYRSELRQLMDASLARIDARFEAFEAKLDAKLARMEGGLIARIALVEARLARQTLIYWMATLATVVALLKL